MTRCVVMPLGGLRASAEASPLNHHGAILRSTAAPARFAATPRASATARSGEA